MLLSDSFKKSKVITPDGQAMSMEDHIKSNPVLAGRAKFAEEYCKKKGWPTEIEKLSIDQLLEVRAQPGWKNPK